MGLRTNGLWIVVAVAALSGCTAKTTCVGDSVDCGGVCVTMAADNLNCGACGNVCGIGTACVDGACAVACAAGQVACGGACVDPMTSTTWCGASGDCTGSRAGTFCASWLTCQAGACTCATSGQIACGGACVDPQTSATHCGASGDCAGANAGTACAAGETCQAGACACPTAGQVACGGACLDPLTSATHCGASGNCAGANAGTTCAAGETCQNGACAPNCTPVVLDLDTPFATDLPSWIAQRPNPLTPTGFWTTSTAPLPTNTAWQNLVLGEGQNRMDFLPYQVKAEPVYLDFGRAPLDNTSGRVSVRTVMQINLSASEFGAATTRKVLSHDLLSATLRYADSGRTMTAPLVQGMPYVTVEYAGGLRPKLAAGLDESPPGPAFRLTIASVNGSATPATVTGTKFKLVMSDGSTWLLYASSSISFNWNHGEMVAASAFAGTLRVANLPAPAAEAVLDSHATVIPLGGEPTVGVGCDVATLRFVYRTNVAGPLLIAAMPHHLARMVSPAVTALTYGSLSGTLTGVEAPTFSGASTLTMRLPLPSITWSAPRPIAPAHEAAVRAALAIDKNFVPPPNVDTHPYWAGKQLAKMARLALIADDLQDAATAAALRSRLRTLLSTWLTGDNGNPFVYDTTWGGVVTTTSILDPGAEFGQGRYNDHHFHYGYFLYAAAVVAKGDPEFATLYRPGILALVRDIANPSGRDPKFPRFRHMDFFRGHSWARGLDVAIDQNQESTSEAVNAWHGMQLLGLALGDSRMSDIGRLLLALELDGARTYWQIPSASTIYQDPFKQNMCVGRLLATAASFDTFFGGAAPQFVYGIQMLPYTPVSEALLSPAWVGDAWTKMATAAAGADQQWAGLLYMAHATVAREAAWSEVFPLTAWDDGNSQTNTFWWVATRP